MYEVAFEQVESEKQKKDAVSLIREYLEWLNDRLRREYGMEFDVEAMVKSDLSDTHKFHPPLVNDARSIRYRRLRLESLEFLDAAHSLYRSVGFHDIDPYTHNSMKSYQPAEQLDRYFSITVFMEMDL